MNGNGTASTGHRSSSSLSMPPASISMAGLPMPAPVGEMQTGAGRVVGATNGGAAGGFEGARSPPGKQNTSHVPCKFFRQGACQAGKACPFSHDLSAGLESVCKYFAKGNCKFGPKCANIHVLPNGQRIQYHKGAPVMQPPAIGGPHMGGPAPPLQLGGRINPDVYTNAPSALSNGLYRANMGAGGGYGAGDSAFPQYGGGPEDFSKPGYGGLDINNARLPETLLERSSAYGSPSTRHLEEDGTGRFGVGSIPAKGLSVLDAPLPASFDSNGVSWIARHGPVASSVPGRFGMMQESPGASSYLGTTEKGSSALKNLYSSAFGEENGESFTEHDDFADNYSARTGSGRVMHSQRYARTKIMSASLPKGAGVGAMGGGKGDGDWDNDFTFEEDYLPDNLRDLLTPAERARRGSRAREEEAELNGSGRPIFGSNGAGSYRDGAFGSPSQASPSRWGPLFQRQQREEEERQASSLSRASAFGHVGSPLRNSLLDGSRTIPRSNAELSGSPYAKSPSRSGLGMSMISQQLARTRLDRAASDNSGGLSALRNSSAPDPIGTPPSSGFGGIGSNSLSARQQPERMVSTGSGVGTGRKFSQIEEENEAELSGDGAEDLFTMEDDGEDKSKKSGGVGAVNAEAGVLEEGGWQFPGVGTGAKPRNGGTSGGGLGEMFGGRS